MRVVVEQQAISIFGRAELALVRIALALTPIQYDGHSVDGLGQVGQPGNALCESRPYGEVAGGELRRDFGQHAGGAIHEQLADPNHDRHGGQ